MGGLHILEVSTIWPGLSERSGRRGHCLPGTVLGVLTADEWEQNWQHVITCDFPGPVWFELGREAGFGVARQVSSIRPASSCPYRKPKAAD